MGHDEDDQARDETGGLFPIGRTSEREPGGMLLGGILIGAAILGLVWVMFTLLHNGSHDAADVPAAHLAGPLADATPADPNADSVDRCMNGAIALSGPLRAAGPAMDQWEVHIGAMNKLVVGQISLQQATSFWNQTRVGARHKIAEFRRSMGLLRQNGVDCPAPGLLSGTASPTLRACSRLVQADLRTLQAAQTAIGTWGMHVQDMERLRDGKLSPAAAGQMWLSMWQRGQHQLDAYRAAARTARQTGGCLGSAPATQPSASPTGMSGMS